MALNKEILIKQQPFSYHKVSRLLVDTYAEKLYFDVHSYKDSGSRVLVEPELQGSYICSYNGGSCPYLAAYTHLKTLENFQNSQDS